MINSAMAKDGVRGCETTATRMLTASKMSMMSGM
jgi:hypothetical protein